GLEVISATVDDLRWDFRSGSDFERWAGAGFGDGAARVPGREAAFVAEVVSRYSEITGSDRTLLFTQLRLRMRRPEASSCAPALGRNAPTGFRPRFTGTDT